MDFLNSADAVRLGKAAADGFASGLSAPANPTLVKSAQGVVKKAMKPIRKIQHLARYSKRQRIRQKYGKRLNWLSQRGF